MSLSLLSASIVLAASSAGQTSPYLNASQLSPEDASLDKLATLSPSFKTADAASSSEIQPLGSGVYDIHKDRGFRGFGGHSEKDNRFGDKTACYINSFCHSSSLTPDPIVCGAGQQLNQTMSGCIDCPSGTYSEAASASDPYRRCSHCPSGTEPNKLTGASTCVPCGTGYYSTSGVSCQKCNGFVITRGSSAEEKALFAAGELLNIGCSICSRYQYFTGVGGSTSEEGVPVPDSDYDPLDPSTQKCASGDSWCEKQYSGNDILLDKCIRQVIIDEDEHSCEICPFGTTADKLRNACVKETCDGGYFMDEYGDCYPCDEDDQYTIGNQSECLTCDGYGITHAFNESRTNCVRCFPPQAPVLGPNGYYICDEPFAEDYYSDTNCGSNKVWVIDSTRDAVKDVHCTKTVNGKTFQPNLYPIRKCAAVGGEEEARGGYIQDAKNLAQSAWIGPNVISCMDAEITGSADIRATSAATGHIFTKSKIKNAQISNTPKFNEKDGALINIQGGTITGGEFNENVTITGSPTIKGGIFTNATVTDHCQRFQGLRRYLCLGKRRETRSFDYRFRFLFPLNNRRASNKGLWGSKRNECTDMSREET